MALLALPGLAGMVEPHGTVSADEARMLAPAPGWPRSLQAWTALPPLLDAYLQDHFGLRAQMVHADALIGQDVLRTGTDSVLIGRHFALFFRGDDAVRQSAGLTIRADWLAGTTDVVARMNRAASAGGMRFIAGFPPNAATMAPGSLPSWARNPGLPTEYDRLLAALAAAGVAAVDLRPVLRAPGSYLRHDTHWSAAGSLAGFNAVASADGHPDWRLDPTKMLLEATRRGGDLARMLGLGDDLDETTSRFTLPDATRQNLGGADDPFLVPGRGRGPRVLVIGDSFTVEAFPIFLRLHAGLVWWMPGSRCRFDWSWVTRLHPDEIWWMPTERYALCPTGFEPAHLP